VHIADFFVFLSAKDAKMHEENPKEALNKSFDKLRTNGK